MAGSHANCGSAGLRAGAPWLPIALFILPVATGLIGTLLPAFGYLPAIGGHDFTWTPWRTLASQPGIATSIRLRIQIGLLATVISLAMASALSAAASQHAMYRRLTQLVAPVLATPHVAVAIGLAFLIAPSGWLVRLVDRPDDLHRLARVQRAGRR